ncbi:MAG: uridine diphosphate-N-acetylglucosamine-binding protein YvcK [Ornithinibacter sp.]
MSGPVVAALGGGHGLAATLSALRYITEEITAIVTVADDGGSSGRLRDEFGVLPPGDLRMALAALCAQNEWGQTWRDVLQHRFAGDGPLGGHALGNLLIVTLWDLHEDPVAGLELVGRLLGAQGRVLPMAAVPLTIEAQVSGLDPSDPAALRLVSGQSRVAVTPGDVEAIHLQPANPPAYPESVAAIRSADWVVLGPGSWFTSVMPHLLVPEVREALEVTRARRLLVLNLDSGSGETSGFSAGRHLETLAALAPGLRLDGVLVDPSVVDDDATLAEHCAAFGARLHVVPVAKRDHPTEHDPLRFAAALRDVLTSPRPTP